MDEAQRIAEETVKRLHKLDETRLDAFNDVIDRVQSMYHAGIAHFSPEEKERIKKKHCTQQDRSSQKLQKIEHLLHSPADPWATLAEISKVIKDRLS